ncbi:hypothetical protein L615_000800000290 [Nocardioides sp. J9]|uniref:hypothetical protein n=1 Tax=unclassified Nocardioides TaxID=2615069 RepID=UPI0004919F1D|nr:MULTISPECIES: hypothetical protein [unclassified Nocardioides]TWG91519.1 hypothetical protein L615_000800000290 [Nocardioides sp. J9]
MTISTQPIGIPQLPRRSSGADPAGGLRRLLALLARGLAAVGTALWHATARTCVLAARLVGWFAAEPRRIGVALAGLGTAAATGVLIGWTTGVVAARVVTAALGVIDNGP